MHYKLRVTTDDKKIMDKVIVWLRRSKVYAYCLETGHKTGKDHMHIYVQIPDITPIKTIRSQLRAICGSGNQKYSLKQINEKYIPIEYLAYMLKDHGKLKYRGIPWAKIQEAKQYKAYKAKALWQKIHIEDSYTEQDIIHAILKYVHDENMPVRRFQILTVYDTIMLHKYGPSGGRWDSWFK